MTREKREPPFKSPICKEMKISYIHGRKVNAITTLVLNFVYLYSLKMLENFETMLFLLHKYWLRWSSFNLFNMNLAKHFPTINFAVLFFHFISVLQVRRWERLLEQPFSLHYRSILYHLWGECIAISNLIYFCDKGLGDGNRYSCHISSFANATGCARWRINDRTNEIVFE